MTKLSHDLMGNSHLDCRAHMRGGRRGASVHCLGPQEQRRGRKAFIHPRRHRRSALRRPSVPRRQTGIAVVNNELKPQGKLREEENENELS